MSELVQRSELPQPPETVDAWHARPGAFARLAPPWDPVELVRWEASPARRDLPPAAQVGDIADGARVTLRMKAGPFPVTWVARHEGRVPGRAFRDVQERGPFAAWEHDHRFLPAAGGGSVLEDRIRYRLPGGALAEWVAGGGVRARLARVFAFRHDRTAMDLARHAEAAGQSWRVAVTGATGLVGEALTAFLRSGGHRVDRLVRGEPEAGTTDLRWAPSEGRLDAAALEGVDAVVHLAGEPVVGRWTDEKKRRILESREQGTALVARAVAALEKRPRVLVCASAVGFYGDRREPVDESAAPGEGFLAEVCQRWEAAADPAREAGVRVVHLRIGVVLSPRGGALDKLLLPFKLGLGGPVGAGDQPFPWLGLDDLLGMIHFAIRHEGLRGPVNAVAPEQVDSRGFAKALGRVLGRPAVLPVPSPAVRLLFGQMGEETLLSGAPVVPRALEEAGFRWEHPTLEEALRFQLGR